MEYLIFSFDNIKYKCQQDIKKFSNNEFDDNLLIGSEFLDNDKMREQLAKISNETDGELRKIYLSYQMMIFAASIMLDKDLQNLEKSEMILALQEVMKKFRIEIFGNMYNTNIGVMTSPTLNFIYTIVENLFMSAVLLLTYKHILIPFFTGKPY